MLTTDDCLALLLTLKLAAVSALLLLLLCTPLAWWLARSRRSFTVVIEALVALPLVLPPTVLGFYLLLAFAPSSPVAQFWLALTGERLAFSFTALVLGSLLYSLPFVMQPLYSAFLRFPQSQWEVAATLGYTPRQRFFKLVLPQYRRQLTLAGLMGFAHTIGEFGVVLMIGGNIPGETRVAAIALFEHVEAGDYSSAHQLAATLLLLSFALLVVVYSLQRRFLRSLY